MPVFSAKQPVYWQAMSILQGESLKGIRKTAVHNRVFYATEVNNFEKRDTYFIFCYCCNKCFSGTMAFLCSMDVSMV